MPHEIHSAPPPRCSLGIVLTGGNSASLFALSPGEWGSFAALAFGVLLWVAEGLQAREENKQLLPRRKRISFIRIMTPELFL